MAQSPTPTTESFARIVVGLDASEASLTSLEWAGRLARELELELSGLYVEDINLIHLAGFHFAREFAPALQLERPLSDRAMTVRLRLQGEKARQALERLAGSSNVRCTFRVLRGDVSAELLATTQRTDLMVIGARDAGGAGRRLGSCTRRLLRLAHSPVLVVPRRPNSAGAVICPYDGSSFADRALRMAARLARVDHKALDLVLLAEFNDAASVESRAMVFLNDYPELQVQVLVQPRLDWHALAARCGRVLVLPASLPGVGDESLEQWIAKERVPVLVTR